MNNSRIFTIGLALVVMTSMFLTSCDALFQTEDRTYEDQPKVELKPQSLSVVEGDTAEVAIQLIGAQRNSDLQVNFNTSGSAQAGNHYVDFGSSATIASGSSSTVLSIITNDVQSSGSVELVIELTGTDSDVGVATNLATSTVFIDAN